MSKMGPHDNSWLCFVTLLLCWTNPGRFALTRNRPTSHCQVFQAENILHAPPVSAKPQANYVRTYYTRRQTLLSALTQLARSIALEKSAKHMNASSSSSSLVIRQLAWNNREDLAVPHRNDGISNIRVVMYDAKHSSQPDSENNLRYQASICLDTYHANEAWRQRC